MLSTERLGALVAVARTGSLAAAADVLFVTPSAVSQQIAALEREVRMTLLERGRRGSRLTPAGRALLAHAEVVLNRLSDAEAELRSLASGETGSLAVGSFPTATAAFVARAVADYAEAHPGVALQLVDGEPADSVARLVARQLDLAVVFDVDWWPASRSYDGQWMCDNAALERVPLFEDPFLLAVPSWHRLAGRRSATLADLEGECFIGSSSACEPWGEALAVGCRRAGFEPTFGASRSPDFFALQACVAIGLGLTLIPRLAITTAREDVLLLPLDEAPVRWVAVALPAAAYRTPAIEAMIGMLQAAAREAVSPLGGAPPPRPRRDGRGSG